MCLLDLIVIHLGNADPEQCPVAQQIINAEIQNLLRLGKFSKENKIFKFIHALILVT
jgi:hypothetical protein